MTSKPERPRPRRRLAALALFAAALAGGAILGAQTGAVPSLSLPGGATGGGGFAPAAVYAPVSLGLFPPLA